MLRPYKTMSLSLSMGRFNLTTKSTKDTKVSIGRARHALPNFALFVSFVVIYIVRSSPWAGAYAIRYKSDSFLRSLRPTFRL
jgi:hypothetical protein